ncbi:response regulator receiver domain protein [Verrucomicrobiia bacterium DG1235]|nr:response regulator receiver domain protein [Verrucomicrobiae bacterium DG1235]
MNNKFTVLYVDDERGNLNAFRNSFRREYNVLVAENAEEGLELIRNEEIDLVLSDQRMPGMSGVEFLKRVIETKPEPNRILVTAYSDFDAIQDAINEACIFKYVKKPWDTEQLRRTIDQALDVYDLRKKNEALNSELSEKNTELEAANHSLRESDQLKYDFLKIISHEMRTPLNGLKGATQLFKITTEREPSNTNKSLLSVLESSTSRLEQFLLLAERITNLKAKQYSLNLQYANIPSLIRDAAEQIAEELQRNQQEIEFDFNGEATLEVDAQILSICVREVLHNAAKHSPHGTKIIARTKSLENDLSIEIVDEGCGFPDGVLRNLFQIFIREDRGNDKSLGLNLALTKLVMDLHGGNVEACNNPDGGATVRLLLNQAKTRQAPSVAAKN